MTKLFALPTIRQIGIRQRSLKRTCRMGRATELVFILATGATLILGSQVQAQTWDGGGADADWNTAANWSANAVPANGGIALIDGSAPANENPTVNADTNNLNATVISGGAVRVNSTLNSAGVDVSGSGQLRISAGGQVRGSSTPTNTALTVNGGLLVNDGTVTGALGITGGAVDNFGVVTGNTNVSSGELNLEAGTNLGDATTLTVSGTGTVNMNTADTVGSVALNGGTIAGAAVLTTGSFAQSGGELSTGATITAASAKTLNGGTIAGTLNGAGAVTVQTGTTTVSGSIVGNVTVGAGGTLRLAGANAVTGSITTTGSVVSYADTQNEASALIISSATTDLEVLGNDAATQSGVISSTGAFGFEKIGTGNLTVSGVNTYTGLTDVSAGTLTVSNDAGLGATGAGNGTNVDAGATLALTGGIDTGEAIALNGTGVGNGGALRNVSGNNTTSGQITLASNARINSDANQLTITGGITGTNTNLTIGGTGYTAVFSNITTGTGSLTVDATTANGVASLFGTNTFTGGTTVNSGFLQLSNGNALADTGALTINAPGTVQVFDGETVGALSGDGTITLQTAGALVAGGAAGSTTFSGVIEEFGAVGAFTKAGAGTLILSGDNSYTGATTVNAGTLNVTGNVDSTVVNVNNGGTLQVDGASLADTAAVTLAGTGNLKLTGSETIGSLAGLAGSVTLGSNTLTTGNALNTSYAGSIAGTGGLTKVGTGTMALTGAISQSGTTTVSAGRLNIETFGTTRDIGDLVVNTGGTLGLDNASLSVDSLTGTGGTIAMTTTNGAVALAFGSDNSSGSFAGGITGDTALTDLIKEGTGTTTLSGVVNTAGAVTVSGGTLVLSGNNTISGGITVDGTLRLEHDNAAGGAAGHITTTGSTIDYADTVNNAAGITIASNTTNLRVTTGAATQSGDIGQDAAGRPLKKIGAGTLTLSGTNTFTGDMTITAGTLAVAGGSALDDAVEVVVAGGATFRLDADEDIGALTSGLAAAAVDVGANGLQIVGAQNTTYAGTLAGTGFVANDGSAKLTLIGNGTAFTGIIGATGAGSELAITGTGKVSAAGIGSGVGATFSTDGGAILASNAVLGADGQVTFTGSETVGSVTNTSANDVAGGTITLTGASTILTVNGSANGLNPGAFNGTNGIVNGTGKLNITGGTFTVGATGNVSTATTIGSAGAVVNNGTMAGVSNAGNFTNNLTAGALTNTGAGAGSNTGTLASLTHNSTGTFTNTGIVNGATSVSNGTVALSGASNLSDTANVTVTGGTLDVNVAEIIGSLSGTGGTVQLDAALTTGGNGTTTSFGGVFAGANALNKVGGGVMTLTGNSVGQTGAINVNAGTLTYSGSGATASTDIETLFGATLNSDGAAFASGLAITNAGALALTGGGDESIASLNGAGTVALSSGSVLTLNTGASAISGVISGAGKLTVQGTSLTTLSGANTNTGDVEVSGGTLVLTGGLAIADLTGVNTSAPGTLRVDAAETIGSLNGSGATVLNAGLTTGGNGFTTEVSGAISGAGGLTKVGTGTMTLSGTNTYTGATTINGGVLELTSGSAIADTGAVIVGNGGTLTVSTNQEVIGSLASSDVATSTAIVNLNAGLVIAGAADTTFDGNITGVGQLTVFGGGTLTLTGANSHTGTMLVGSVAGSEIALTGAGTTASGIVAAAAGGLITTDGGALASNATLVVDGATATLTGSETISRLTGNGPPDFTGTVNLNGAATVLTLNGSTGASGVGGIIAGTGTLNVTGNTTTVAALGDVQTATTIGASGTVVNNGKMAGVSNAGSFTNNLTAGALTNTGAGAGSNAATGTLDSIAHNSSGTFTNSGAVTGNASVSSGILINGGTIGGTASVTGGTFSVAGGTITGATTNTGGLVTFSAGTFTGGLTNTTGTVEGQGTLVGNVTNSASFVATGDITGNGANVFTNNGTGNVNLLTSSMTNLLSFSNTGTTNIGAGKTLGAATVTNAAGGQMFVTSGTVAGAFTNAGTLTVGGASAVTGAFTNNGTVDLADAVFGDSLSISGIASGTGVYQLDLNLTSFATDVIHANGGTSGNVNLAFSTGVTGGVLMPATTVFSGLSGGSTYTFSGLPVGGAILYSVTDTGGNIQVAGGVNPAIGGVAAGAAMTQSLIGSVVNRPTSALISGLAAEESCSHGGYMRGTAGVARVQGTTTSTAGANTTGISSQFYGVQGGYDIGCYDGRFFGGWDGTVGVMLGYNMGSTKQGSFSNPVSPTTQTGTTGSDFQQSYVGLYLAGAKDRFSADLQLRFDDTKFKLSETFDPGFEIGLDGLSYGTKTSTLGARMSYRMDVNEEAGINFVPTMGFNYSSTTGDTLTMDDNGTPLDTSDDETLEIAPFNTVVGFLGGTLTKTKISEAGDSATTSFVSGNYYRDFGGDRAANYENVGLGVNEDLAIGSIGGFVEASIGLNYLKVLEKGPGGAKQLNAAIRADARFGDNVSDAYSLTAQVRLSF